MYHRAAVASTNQLPNSRSNLAAFTNPHASSHPSPFDFTVSDPSADSPSNTATKPKANSGADAATFADTDPTPNNLPGRPVFVARAASELPRLRFG